LRKLPRTKRTLEKRIATLRTLLAQNASEYTLLKAAGRVRDAKIQVLIATIGDIPHPVVRTCEQERIVAKWCDQIESLRAATPMVVLSEFR
jgi:hypothetical protein